MDDMFHTNMQLGTFASGVHPPAAMLRVVPSFFACTACALRPMLLTRPAGVPCCWLRLVTARWVMDKALAYGYWHMGHDGRLHNVYDTCDMSVSDENWADYLKYVAEG